MAREYGVKRKGWEVAAWSFHSGDEDAASIQNFRQACRIPTYLFFRSTPCARVYLVWIRDSRLLLNTDVYGAVISYARSGDRWVLYSVLWDLRPMSPLCCMAVSVYTRELELSSLSCIRQIGLWSSAVIRIDQGDQAPNIFSDVLYVIADSNFQGSRRYLVQELSGNIAVAGTFGTELEAP